MSSKSVVVLGAGVIGLSCALEAARRGHRVTVIERAAVRRDGCSFGNAGMIVPSHFIPLAAPGMVALGLKWMWNPESPFYIQPRLDWGLISWGVKFWSAATPSRVAAAAPVLRDYHLLSRACFVEQAAEMNFGLAQHGLIMLCRTQHALDEEARTAAQAVALGVPAEVLDAGQVAALDPDATFSVAGGVYFPKDCHLCPERYVAALQTALGKLGGEIRWETEITGWRTDRDRVVAAETTSGEIAGDEFILAGGSWSPQTAAALSLNLPMQAGKGYSVTLRQPRQLPRICSILTEARVAVTPMDGALRVGGTMEIAGLNDRINPRRVRGIVRALPDYYPAFRAEDFDGIEPWRGLRPCSPDGLPYLGRTEHWQNLIISTGHSMMGLSLAPATGRIVGQLLDSEKTAVPLGLLSPDRYA